MANALLITVPTDTLNDTLRGVSKVIDEMLSDLLAFLSDLVAVSSVCFFEVLNSSIDYARHGYSALY
ncbi:Protein of unknown function [Pyronema omphalodes CBS 100304]|uniref:Uncharacterized protein n=1 Tax=Pyronema omphalodes (strain CBS 100304) TaxID=1076935 RepID=U4LUX8_PYROM|nr:Protein of unknown function [Pyronema omphalodes CBS 100304]